MFEILIMHYEEPKIKKAYLAIEDILMSNVMRLTINHYKNIQFLQYHSKGIIEVGDTHFEKA